MSEVDTARRRTALALLLAQQMAQEASDADKRVEEMCRVHEGTIDFSKTQFSLRAKVPIFVLKLWAEVAMGFLDDCDAPNFREMHFEFRDPESGDVDGPPVVVTVQRPGGKSPAVVAGEAKDRAAALKARLALYEPVVRAAEAWEAAGTIDPTHIHAGRLQAAVRAMHAEQAKAQKGATT